MNTIKTDNYTIHIDKKGKNGPAGYEATYLTDEGEPFVQKHHQIFSDTSGTFLPAEIGTLRHRNFEAITAAHAHKKPIGVVSGFKPSGAFHFGHRLVTQSLAFFQRNGFQIYMPIADIECQLDSRITHDHYNYFSADNLLDIGASGVDLDSAHVYLQSEEQRVSSLAYTLARELSLDFVLDTYGAQKMVTDFPFLFAGVTQVGDIVLPQHSDFGLHNSFMLSGQDQDGHMKMAIQLANKAGFHTPAGLYIPHMRGMYGDKASSSRTKETLYLGSGPHHETKEERITSAYGKIQSAPVTQMEKCALDMVLYLEDFRAAHHSDVQELCASPEYQSLEKQSDRDNFLARTDVISEVESVLENVLTVHQQRRKEIVEYAQDLSQGKAASKPSFWNTTNPISSTHRNKTQWFDIVAREYERLIP